MTPKWILWRIITTSWKFLSRRIFLKKEILSDHTGRFSQNRRVVRPRRTNDKARFILCFIANCFILGTKYKWRWSYPVPAESSQSMPHAHNANTFIPKMIYDERLTTMLPLLWCKVSIIWRMWAWWPKSHFNTCRQHNKGWYRDLRWLMISKQAQRSQVNEQFQKIIKDQSEATMKNQWLWANQSKKC